MENKALKIFEAALSDERLLEEISKTPCPTCKDKMTVGEENAGGVCTDCYFKYSDHDSSTGE
jgi:hypothetical protein